METRVLHSPDRSLLIVTLCAVLLVGAPAAAAQETGSGTISGTATRRADGSRLSGVLVQVKGTALGAVSGTDGRFTLHRVPEGRQALLFGSFGYRPE
jgi:tetrahydromethanopterin S-methyltransferase subunit D